ncbi:NYN domain-containing protein [Sanguibacter sp. HDW7]|uniref:NYN domain-containing protein n=1 Tax=Sanguibacter sp. HDW7 TaxID=2714931 RepID=UPI00140CC947|nr:NYN domain-containing protein [Sanguibacter sp. HDW7]QIK82237.1 NYN domain-containing protein [Sanguibacter sp. HDW7]
MAAPNGSQRRLAVLVDADNASAAIIEGLLEEVARYGVATVKRIYGDWTSQQMNSWKRVLLAQSLQPVQQFAYTAGKNATDSALIIDAMDLLHTGDLDGFCIVSSDSDFTRLASRLRESGKKVYGFGEEKTPEAFVAACDQFIYTDVLRRPAADPAPVPTGPSKGASPVTTPKKPQPVPFRFICQAIDDISGDDDWALLSQLGSHLTKLRPGFDPRLYGFTKLSTLLAAQPDLEVTQAVVGNGATAVVRIRPSASPALSAAAKSTAPTRATATP